MIFRSNRQKDDQLTGWLKIWCMLIFLFLSGFLLAQTRTVKVGISQNDPKMFIEPSGKPAGIFIDILEAIAAKEDWKLEYYEGSFDAIYYRVAKGDLDLMPDVAISPTREKDLDFHKEPVLSSWSQIYTRKGLEINSILDLDGHSIAVLEKSIQHNVIESWIKGFGLKVKIIKVHNFDAAFAAVANGIADCAVSNYLYGRRHCKQYGLVDTGVVFEPATLYFATTKGKNQDLLDAIDKHLLTMKKVPNSAYYAALKRWVSKDEGFMLPAWLKFTILIVILALVLTVIYGLTLKHQVNIRTLELRKSNQEMEQRIIERTAELEKAMLKAKEADMLKSAFLATMSHELRTPLNSIIGFTGILLQELPGHINEEQRKQLTIVQNSAHHLLDLINDILDISKIESGQLDLHYESFFLNDSIDKVVKIVMPQAEKKGLELKVEISQSELEVYCDKRRLEQVILNLISNAIKFTETGYVAIIVHSEEDKYQIQVQDTGIGIAPEDLEQLFLPFHQIDTGLTRQYEGTGLGLNICLKLINMMGGTITVDSIPGKGSIFTVIMPYKKEFTG